MNRQQELDMIEAAEQAMETEAYPVFLPLVQEADAGPRQHRHVAIAWEGGVLWLDMSVQHDHYCVDVRQFTADAELAGQGVFTIVNGRRQVLADPNGTEEMPLADPDGTPVKGHGWNAGYVITLMHDKVPSERQTNRPAGPGRG